MKSALVENKLFLVLLVLIVKFITEILTREFELGPCYLQYLEPCANNSIQFYLFTSDRPRDGPVLLDNISPDLSLDSNETITKNFKMIIHGYGGHLDFNGSKQIRKGKGPPYSRVLKNCWLQLCRFVSFFCIGQNLHFVATFPETHIRQVWDFPLAACCARRVYEVREKQHSQQFINDLIINLRDYSL